MTGAANAFEGSRVWGLLRLLRGHRRLYAVSVAGIIVRHTALIAGLTVAGYAVGLASQGDSGSLPVVSGAAVALVVLASVAAWVENYASHLLSFAVLAELRSDLLDRLLRAPRRLVAGRRVGDLASTIQNDAEALEIFYAHSSLYVLGAVTVGPAVAVAATLADPVVGLIVALALAGCLGAPLALREWSTRQGRRQQDAIAATLIEAEETVGALREVVAFGLQRRQLARLAAATSTEERARAGTAVRSGAEAATAAAVGMLGVIAAVAVVAPRLAAGSLTPAHGLALLALVAAAPAPVLQLVAVTRHWTGTRAAFDRITALLQTLPARLPGRERLVGSAALEVRFEDVHVGWPGPSDPDSAQYGSAQHVPAQHVPAQFVPAQFVPALRGLSLTVRPGETMALIGASGAGKSSAVSLLDPSAAPDRGRILVDGLDLTEVDPADWQRSVAVVGQDSTLVDDTLRANLLLGLPADRTVDDAALWQALAATGAGAIVDRLPAGLDSQVGSGGGSYSGGERQRLALARALLSEPRLLVLDEALSQLDPESESELRPVLSAGPRRTVLLIAHRPATILAADRVAVLAAGRLIDVGTPAELLARCAAFTDLVRPRTAASPLSPSPLSRGETCS